MDSHASDAVEDVVAVPDTKPVRTGNSSTMLKRPIPIYTTIGTPTWLDAVRVSYIQH